VHVESCSPCGLFHLSDDRRLVAASGFGPAERIARDVKIAEMLIGRRSIPDPQSLAWPATRLKSPLAS
jgi:3-phenylpropionate/trans-cinnamate dioxygenase ferredoxin reductase component